MNKKVLVLGTENSVLTPMMAELIKHLTYKKVDVESAGIYPKEIHPLAVKVLLEMGITMSEFTHNSISQYAHTKFDIIITTSKVARDSLHILMSCRTKIHREFDNPTKIEGNEIQMQNAFRQVRDEMNEWLNEFLTRHRLI
jgi:arsenate reductase (thioredoxin)